MSLKKGFTLLEVIIAIFFLGVLTLPLFQAFKKSAGLTEYNFNKRAAVDIAANFLTLSTYNSEASLAQLNYNQNLFQLASQVNYPQAGVKNVQVNVSWQDQLGTGNVELSQNYYAGIN